MNAAGCETFFQETIRRIEAVVREKYPSALGFYGFWDYVMAEHRGIYDRYKSADREMNEHWRNGNFAEMKKFCLEWGRAQIELFRLVAAHLQEADHGA